MFLTCFPRYVYESVYVFKSKCLNIYVQVCTHVSMYLNLWISGLSRISVCSVCRSLCWQCGIPNNQVDSEATRHLPVVVQVRSVHWNEEWTEFKAMVEKLVLQSPDGSGTQTT